jgi:hypothetical protein
MGLILQELRPKTAAKPKATYSMSGRLYLSASGWLLLSVPNSLVRGAFDALDEPGIELPVKDGKLNAHISVMNSSEVDQIGADKITERGHTFAYQTGKVKETSPGGWAEMSKVWMIEVKSPELQKLRKSYGLSALPHDGEYQFHITLAVRRKNVLRNSDVRKAAGLFLLGGNGIRSCTAGSGADAGRQDGEDGRRGHGPGDDQEGACFALPWLKTAKPTHVPTVGVDFDGTIAEAGEKFEEDVSKLKPRPGAKKWMDEFQALGARIIIFTVRSDAQGIKDWCHDNDIPYDYVNENPDQPPDASGKVFADVYWDDRAISAAGALSKSGPEVLSRLEKVGKVHPFRSVNEDPDFRGLVKARHLSKTALWPFTGGTNPTSKPAIPASKVSNPAPPQKLPAQYFSTLPMATRRTLTSSSLGSGGITHQTRVSPANAIAHYYQNIPGGLAAAAQKATDYNKQHSVPGPSLDLSRRNLVSPRTEHTVSSQFVEGAMGGPGYGGYTSAGKPYLVRKLLQDPNYQAHVREHELTHQLQRRFAGWDKKPISPRGSPLHYTIPREMDAAFAGPVKRMYAQLTGKLVTTPEEAAEALDYIRFYRPGEATDMLESIPEDVAKLPPENRQTLQTEHDRWQAIPEDQRERLRDEILLLRKRLHWQKPDVFRKMLDYLKRRMPGIVSTSTQNTSKVAAEFEEKAAKKREQPAGYIKETEEIKARREDAGAKPHKFQAAEWTHPNGHPRCKLCGDEETMDGQCDGYKAAEFSKTALWPFANGTPLAPTYTAPTPRTPKATSSGPTRSLDGTTPFGLDPTRMIRMRAQGINNPPPPKSLGAINWDEFKKTTHFDQETRLPHGSSATSPSVAVTQITPATMLAPRYKNIPGGLAAAAAKAQDYNEKHPMPTTASELDLSARNLLKPVKEYAMRPDKMPWANGLSDSEAPFIARQLGQTPGMREMIRSHELTHQLQAPYEGQYEDNLTDGEGSRATHATNKTEIDAYIVAPSKRLYAEMTGNLVTNEEEAKQALEFVTRLSKARYQDKETWNSLTPQQRRDLKSIDSTKRYFHYPPPKTKPPSEMLRYILKRMPGIVSTRGSADTTGKFASLKTALAPFWQRAMKAQLYQPVWSANTGVLQNIAQNLRSAHQRGQAMVGAEDAVKDFYSGQSQQAALDRMSQYLQHGDTTVTNPLDRLLFRPIPSIAK